MKKKRKNKKKMKKTKKKQKEEEDKDRKKKKYNDYSVDDGCGGSDHFPYLSSTLSPLAP